MVIPFLSIYLTDSRGFSLAQVGWIMTAFGCGSMIGTWIGGKITDTIGHYKVMLTSLFFTGIGFLLLMNVNTFYGFCISIFFLVLVADSFRPAMFVALSAYSKKENKTRSVTLIRLAINLGFSAGPAVGGIIITTMGYRGLFWVDGITCILATLLMLVVLHPKKAKPQEVVTVENPLSVYKDKVFQLFFVAVVLYSFIFLQLFSTVPVFLKQYVHLSEYTIGLLMAMNGMLIFLFEMPLIKFCESRGISDYRYIILGTILTALTFLVFNLFGHIGLVMIIIAVLFMSFGEMIALPFSNAFALKRASLGNQGEFMAMYSLAFSISHILAHNISMQVADAYGYRATFWLNIVIGIICVLLLYFTMKKWSHEIDRSY